MSICVMVLSYNRPRLIREALASIPEADQVIIADDGSSFPVEALSKEFPNLNLEFVLGRQLSLDERLKGIQMYSDRKSVV